MTCPSTSFLLSRSSEFLHLHAPVQGSLTFQQLHLFVEHFDLQRVIISVQLSGTGETVISLSTSFRAADLVHPWFSRFVGLSPYHCLKLHPSNMPLCCITCWRKCLGRYKTNSHKLCGFQSLAFMVNIRHSNARNSFPLLFGLLCISYRLANSLLTCCNRSGFPYIATQFGYHVCLMLFWLLFSFTTEVKKSISKKCYHFINVWHKIFHLEYPSFNWKLGGGAPGVLMGHIILDNIILESKGNLQSWIEMCIS